MANGHVDQPLEGCAKMKCKGCVDSIRGTAEISEYSPLIRNPHLLTIASHFWPSGLDERRFSIESKRYATAPGVEVLVETSRPAGAPVGELVIVHGLEGSSQSGYMKSMARAALEAGFVAHRFNLRSCGGMERFARTGYHSGMTGDLLEFLRQLRAAGSGPVSLVGFSLGGNVVLKLAGELGEEARGWVRAVCGISTPIDLAACARRLEQPENRIYARRFVRRLKRRIRLLAPGSPGAKEVRTVWEFDDRITAPAFGFQNAAEYYETQSCQRYLDGIRVPTLLIQAKDDPVIPFEVFERRELFANPALELLAVEHGGHVGFISRRRPWFWPGRVVMEWIAGH
jgi:predicted alpha/beta-fold hydrolase